MDTNNKILHIDKDKYKSIIKKLRFLDKSNKALISLQDKVEKLATFHSELILSHDLSYVFETGFDKIREMVEVESSSLFFVDEKNAEFVHHMSLPAQQHSIIRREVDAQIGSGNFGRAVTNGSSICVPAFSIGKSNNKRMRVMITPLHTKDRTIGILFIVFAEDEACIRQGVLRLLYILTDSLALSLANAHLFEDLSNVCLDTIRTLINAVEAKDSYTRGHSLQVTELALKIGQELDFSNERMELLQTAALLHDVGKIGVAESILLKPGSLTSGEYEHIKQHPAIGAAILRPIKSLGKVAEIVYHHHERYDGEGYMDGLKEDEIPLAARILAVCDTFSAMTSDRPHRRALSEEKAITELKRVAGTQLDPLIVKIFLTVLQKKMISVEKMKVIV